MKTESAIRVWLGSGTIYAESYNMKFDAEVPNPFKMYSKYLEIHKDKTQALDAIGKIQKEMEIEAEELEKKLKDLADSYSNLIEAEVQKYADRMNKLI